MRIKTPHRMPPGFMFNESHGWLYPHSLAIQTLGAGSDYHLRKNFQRLLPGTHYLKIKGPDHINRVFYTLPGLLLLCEMLRTPQSFAIAQQIQKLEQSASFPQLPAYGHSPASPLTVYQGEFADSVEDTPHSPYPPVSGGYPLTSAPSPSDLGMMPPVMPSEPERPVTAPQPSSEAQTIFEAQKLVKDAMLQGQQQQFIHSNIESLWDDADHFLKRQDTLAVSLLLSGVFCVLCFGTYAIASSLRSPAPNHSNSTSIYR